MKKVWHGVHTEYVLCTYCGVTVRMLFPQSCLLPMYLLHCPSTAYSGFSSTSHGLHLQSLPDMCLIPKCASFLLSLKSLTLSQLSHLKIFLPPTTIISLLLFFLPYFSISPIFYFEIILILSHIFIPSCRPLLLHPFMIIALRLSSNVSFAVFALNDLYNHFSIPYHWCASTHLLHSLEALCQSTEAWVAHHFQRLQLFHSKIWLQST